MTARTENTRASYPLEFIDNAIPEKMGGHPKNIILLTCDASGVMPPIARLTPDQALYHFISGYTSKIAGTEIGLGEEPEITFSTCFGGPFMVHHPGFLCRPAQAQDRALWRQLLAGQHRLGGRPVRRGQAHQHPLHPQPAERRPGRRTAERAYYTDPIFGFQVPKPARMCPTTCSTRQSWPSEEQYMKRYHRWPLALSIISRSSRTRPPGTWWLLGRRWIRRRNRKYNKNRSEIIRPVFISMKGGIPHSY